MNSCYFVGAGTEMSRFLPSLKEICHAYTNMTPMYLFAVMICYLKMRTFLIEKKISSAIVGNTKLVF